MIRYKIQNQEGVCFVTLRIEDWVDVFICLGLGLNFNDILCDFPEFTKDDIIAALEFSAVRRHEMQAAA